MKTLSSLIFSLLLTLFAACGGTDTTTSSAAAPCANTVILGSWRGTISGHSDTLTFNSNCTGSSSLCQSSFSFGNVTATSGSALITVTSTVGGASCLPVGTATCNYSLSGNSLTYNCGGSNLNYTKI